ncbi:TerB N-terminal domain-containing protein [Salinicola sp. CPA57]|uniref:tellurite resistance TerB family protein n=1 Tax=Salinicola sp. CPA57 TaxID=1949080 RepID=UPI0013008CA2|nr:TerB N-terminal domain-containing protein [Salinicola sp. CPA57]
MSIWLWIMVGIGLLWAWKARQRKRERIQENRVNQQLSVYLRETSEAEASPGIRAGGLDRYSWAEPDIDYNVTPDKCWIPAGHSTTIAGVQIEGGWLYVGRGLAASNTRSLEPALIDPSAKVVKSWSDSPGDSLGYWPSYQRISPAARAEYLSFLASGKDDPDVALGYVFLYFYGLERRLLVDFSAGCVSDEEYEALVVEVERLLVRYGRHGSFSGYATRLIDYVSVLRGTLDEPSDEPSFTGMRTGLPSRLVVDLGIFSSQGKPIPAPWAYAWAIQDPQFRLRAPAERCPEEFKALFSALYAERYGSGITIKPNKTLLTPSYRPASSGIPAQSITTQLPDVTILKRPSTAIAALVDECCSQLDAYSRFVGKYPDRRDSVEGLTKLPAMLAGDRKSEAVMTLEATLKEELATLKYPRIALGDLIEDLSIEMNTKPTAKGMIALAGILETAGIGLEPDYRYTRVLPYQDSRCIIFAIDHRDHLPPSDNFSQASLVLRLAGFVLHGQGNSLTERHHAIVDDYLDQLPAVSEHERRHLLAYFQWEIERKSTLGGMRRHVDEMNELQREQLEHLLIRLASADGVVDTDEIKKLRRASTLLGRDPDALYARIHSAMAEPVTVRRANKATRSFSIPAPAAASGTESARNADMRQPLDRDAIDRKRAESEELSGVLSNIFSDKTESTGRYQSRPSTPEVMPVAPDTQIVSEPQNIISGLDDAHLSLLDTIADCEQGLTTIEAQRLAGKLGVLLAGAIDTINEVAYEKTDAPVLEEEDGVLVVDSEILEEMKG